MKRSGSLHLLAVLMGLAGSVVSSAAGNSAAATAEKAATDSLAAASPSNAIDLSGEWEAVIDAGDEEIKIPIRLARDGNGWKGTLTGPDGVTYAVSAFIDGDRVTLSGVEKGPDGTERPRSYVYTLTNGAMLGTITTNEGRTLPVEIRRKAPSASAATGEWKLHVEATDRVLDPTLILREVNGVLTGEVALDADQKIAFGKIDRDGDLLRASFDYPDYSGPVRVDVSFRIDGDTLKGNATYASGSAVITGTRKAAAKGFEGEWDFTATTPEQVYKSVVSIRREGDVYKGDYTIPEGVTITLKSISVSGNTLKFDLTISGPNGGDSGDSSFSGTLDGDTIRGDLSTPWGTVPVTAKRRPASPKALAGDWSVTVTGPDGEHKGSARMTVGDGGLTGAFTGEGADASVSAPIKNLTLDGEALHFIVETPSPTYGPPTRIEFNGTLKGDVIEAVGKTPEGTWTLIARRKPPVFAKDITGTWAMELRTPDGVMPHEMRLKLDGETLTGTLQGPGGEIVLQEGSYRNGQLSAAVTVPIGGQEMKMTMTGKSDGETLSGMLSGDWGGVSWTAKRKP